MSFWLIVVPTLCYLCASGMYLFQKNWPLAITYFGYFFANIGLLMLDHMMAK